MARARSFAARALTAVEGAVAKLFGRKRVAQAIEPYTGYATETHLVARGRVLAVAPSELSGQSRSRVANIRQMLRLFVTREVADVTVRAGAVSAQSDEEGYFTLLIPREDQAGRVDVTVSTGEVSAICPVIVPRTDADFGVISDIDDTMMETGAWSLWRNVWTSLTGNVASRKIFPDARELMQVLHRGGQNPVYFVSSSPWNFHGFLKGVFERNGLPDAPKFLRDYGLSDTQLITGTHGDHKGASIDVILAAVPELPFVLIGDLGQHDATIYAAAVERHPGRIAHILLREAGPGDDEDRMALEKLKTLGVPVLSGPDYRKAIAVFGDGV